MTYRPPHFTRRLENGDILESLNHGRVNEMGSLD